MTKVSYRTLHQHVGIAAGASNQHSIDLNLGSDLHVDVGRTASIGTDRHVNYFG